MRRKVVRHGPSSLTISLPMPWVKNNSLKNGDEVDVTEKGNELVISGQGKKEPKEISIFLSGKKQFIKRMFNMPYLRGYDIINVNFDSFNVMEKIQQCIGIWRSFEIVEQKENYCKLKSIADARPEELESMIIRMFNICGTVFDELLLYTKDKNEDALKRILLLDVTLTSIDLFCRRIINQGRNIEPKKMGSTYAKVRCLENVGDVAKEIANQKPKIRPENRKDFVKLIEMLQKSFALLRQVRYKREMEPMYEYKDIKDKLRVIFNQQNAFNKDEMFMFMSLRQLVFILHDLSEEVVLWTDAKHSSA